MDRERVVRYANRAAARYLGHAAAGGLIQRPLRALGAPWAASLDALCAAVLTSGHTPARTELSFTDAARNCEEPPAVFDVEAEPTRDQAGHLQGVALVLRDATERVLLREAHQAAQEKARLLARALQSDILTRGNLCPVPGYSLAVSYCPMDTEHDLGGDFFRLGAERVLPLHPFTGGRQTDDRIIVALKRDTD